MQGLLVEGVAIEWVNQGHFFHVLDLVHASEMFDEVFKTRAILGEFWVLHADVLGIEETVFVGS